MTRREGVEGLTERMEVRDWGWTGYTDILRQSIYRSCALSFWLRVCMSYTAIMNIR
jgi:hypothetical protein